MFGGSFQGVLRWPQLDQVWQTVLSHPQQSWYVYAVGDLPPKQAATPTELAHFIRGLDDLLRKEHAEDYCGIVYVDDFHQPSLIKIFDPHNLGTMCGSKGGAPLPAWIISQLQPVDLPHTVPVPRNRQRWWQQLLASYKS
ncbi:MAG TPA: hypothetical protein PLM98_17245 [Thiolinea sp.]|nr:hypothetical protein [Thiolinea sp.]